MQKRKTHPSARSSEKELHSRRSLLAQLNDEVLSTTKIPAEPSHSLFPPPAPTSVRHAPGASDGGSKTVEFQPLADKTAALSKIAALSKPKSPGKNPTEPLSLEVKPTDTTEIKSTKAQSLGTNPASSNESQSPRAKPAESQSLALTTVPGTQPGIPEPQGTPEKKSTPVAKQGTATSSATVHALTPGVVPTSPTTKDGVKLPPGAVPVFTLVAPSVTPVTVKLPPAPGAVPRVRTGVVSPATAAPPITSTGVKLPPGAVSVFPPGIAPSAITAQQLTKKDSKEENTAKLKQATPPVHPKPKYFEHASSSLSGTPFGSKIPSNAVQVLPFQQAPPAKISDNRKQGEMWSQGQLEANNRPVSNGIHSNGISTNGVEVMNGELETPISFDQVSVSDRETQ